jgi:hypothetical protein
MTTHTSFSLVFIDTESAAPLTLSSVNYSLNFCSVDGAESHLSHYLANKIINNHLDEFSCRFNLEDRSEQAASRLLNSLQPVKVIEFYQWLAIDKGIQFEYAIKEVPTKSFIEAVWDADAIEINGNFIRHFNIETNIHKKAEGQFIEASMIDDDFNELNYEITYDQAMAAKYDNATGCWSVGGHDVVLYVFKKRD